MQEKLLLTEDLGEKTINKFFYNKKLLIWLEKDT